jgi:hypothetical protein
MPNSSIRDIGRKIAGQPQLQAVPRNAAHQAQL